jgi:hypothetical protein
MPLTHRDKLLIRRRQLRASIALRRRTLAKLEAELADLEESMDAMGGPPKRYTLLIPHRAKAREIRRPLLEMLRERGAITAPELAAEMLARFGLPADDPNTKYAMDQRCFRALERCSRRGLVEQDGKRGHAALWRLVRREISVWEIA